MYILLNKYFYCTVFKKTDAVNTFRFLCVYDMRIWNAFTQTKRWNAHAVTLRAVLGMLFLCLCPHTSRALQCVWAKGKRASLSSIHNEIWSRNNAALLQASSILTLHRPFLSTRYLSRLCFSSEHERWLSRIIERSITRRSDDGWGRAETWTLLDGAVRHIFSAARHSVHP